MAMEYIVGGTVALAACLIVAIIALEARTLSAVDSFPRRRQEADKAEAAAG